MDVDAPEEVPDFLPYFDLSPEGFPWREPRPHEIEARRAKMSDLLIFDILLNSGGIREPHLLWPPTDVASLQRLLDAIQNSAYDALKRDCLIYFLLKWHGDGREEGFKEDRSIPPQFSALSDAYWHLDSGIDVPRAVSLLSDPRLNRDYTSKILEAISLSDDPTPLILSFIRTAKPLLTEPDDIDMYAVALAETHFMDAWQFQRSYPEHTETRKRLLRKIIEWTLSPSPRPGPLTQLIAYPFSAVEQTLIHNFALDPPSSLPQASIPVLQHLVCVRLIQCGKYAEAVKLDRQFSDTPHGQRNSKAVEDRRKMVDEVVALLPSIERLQIEEQIAELGKPKSSAATKSKTKATEAAGDLSMSWEDLQPLKQLPTPAPSASGSRPFVLGRGTVPTPRFGASTGSQRASNNAPLAQEPAAANAPHRDLFSSVGRADKNTQGSLFGNSPSHALPPIIPLSGSTNTRPAGKSGFNPSGRVPRHSQGSSLFGSTNAPLTTSPGHTSLLFCGNAASSTSKRNAFYNPPEDPRPTNGTAVRPPAAAHDTDDAAMDADDAAMSQHDDASDVEEPEPEPDQPAQQFLSSVFGRDVPSHTTQVEEPLERSFPGAFQDDDDEPEPARRQPPSPSTSPPPAKTRQTRASRARKAAAPREPSVLSRSIPGGFMDDVHEPEAQEQDDDIAPLVSAAPLKRGARKGRGTRASTGSAHEEVDADGFKPRRSSRLSVASSSPEASPQKPRVRKTRASATGVGAGATKSSSSGRRKR